MTQPAPAYPTELSAALDRLVLMQEDVYPGSKAVPVSFYAQEQGPYWTNDPRRFSIEVISMDLQVATWTIAMTLVLDPVGSGFNQENERKKQLWATTVLQYFSQRRQLKRTSADPDVPFLDPNGAQITGGQVRNDIPGSGIGQIMFGIEFDIEVPLYQETDQVVF